MAGCMSQPIYDRSLPMVVNPLLPALDEYNIRIKFKSKKFIEERCNNNLASACAIPFVSPCLLYMQKENYLYMIVHEINHCVNGLWH